MLGGGWIASGPAGPDRVPTPVWPRAMALVPNEGAGEVQTPLRGAGAADLRIGDLTWWRHAKAGALCEHTDELVVVRTQVTDGEVSAEVVETVPTYRGEGRAFL